MKLMYSWRELLPFTPDFAQSRWNATVDMNGVAGSITAGKPYGTGLAIDDPAIHEFDGTITEIDDEAEDIYVTVVDADGREREFNPDGDLAEYRVGRRMIVRYLVPGYIGGAEIMKTVQVWLA